MQSFIRFKLLNDALIVFSQEEVYRKHWDEVQQSITVLTKNIELSLNQVIVEKREKMGGVEYSLPLEDMSNVENLDHFKQAFYDELIRCFNLNVEVDRQDSIKKMKKIIDNYKLYHVPLSLDEKEVLDNENDILSKLLSSIL